MTDIYDQATAQEEMARELALAALRSIKPCITPKGRCYNCNEASGARLFCDENCRDDWQTRNPNK